MKHLGHKYEHPGIRNFLVNKLIKLEPKHYEFYLLELCFFLYKKSTPDIEILFLKTT